MSAPDLRELRRDRDRGRVRGVTSVCSAHPLVIEAALLQARADGGAALIEATCNQVNPEGGYTGMTPAGFRDAVHAIADTVDFPRERVVLGGDHLGPNPWRALPAADAMARATAMVEAYAAAGFGKLHLDCSMGCAGEPPALGDAEAAARAVFLARAAEASAAGATTPPVYVIGTEVPTPGGATEALDHLQPTAADAAAATYDVHRRAFAAAGLDGAWSRVIAMVVQPGVEFGHADIAVYRPERARALRRELDALPALVFDAHSTDYQPERALAALVEDGFAILKVGPALTFALREALYALDAICGELGLGAPSLRARAEAAMLADPAHWRSHYGGSEAEQEVLRHYSYSDRIRYYWGGPALGQAVADLLGRFGARPIPPTLLSQFMPRVFERVAAGAIAADARTLVLQSVRDVLGRYARACRTGGEP